MTDLDKAFDLYMQDEEAQAPYYDLVLKSNFFIPVHSEGGTVGQQDLKDNNDIVPLILEAEGKEYLMLFESEERLTAWAKEETSYVVVSGDAIVQMTPPQLHLALNVGTDYQKQFVPDEINWLKEIIKQYSELVKQQQAQQAQ
ncbi:MAG: SseB family protein [Thermodesulfobacteriota bacterium]|nr:SseB family protein [Thermodesulfobacteriota bacterium]